MQKQTIPWSPPGEIYDNGQTDCAVKLERSFLEKTIGVDRGTTKSNTKFSIESQREPKDS